MGNTADKALPYTIREEVNSGTEVTVFRLNKKAPSLNPAHVQLAVNALTRLRTVRHPHVLRFLDGVETEEAVFVVTEAVQPLVEWVAERSTSSTMPACQVWGLYTVAKALAFINNDCKMVHGNVCRDSVFVTKGGDWCLGGFELLCAATGGTPDAFLQDRDQLVNVMYKSPERVKRNWPLLGRAPTHALDAWSFGCLVQEVLGAPMESQADVRNTSRLPTGLRGDYQRLLATGAASRLNPARFLENPYFDHPLVSTLLFLDELALKEAAEKQAFFKRLPALVSDFPDDACHYKILPSLLNALEFGSAGGSVVVLASVLDIGARLPKDEYQATVVPRVVRLFASNDRATRMQLLERLESLLPNIDDKTVNNEVFNNVVTGFTDTEPVLREATVKACLHMPERLTTANKISLLKFLRKLLSDLEPTIRVNTTVCMGRMAKHFDAALMREFILPSFMRGLKDPFPHVRTSALRAISHTAEQVPPRMLATQILPVVMTLSVDPWEDCRTLAITCVEKACGLLREASAATAAKQRAEATGDKAASGSTAAAGGSASATSSAVATAAARGVGAMAGAFGWAMGTLKNKVYKDGPMEAGGGGPSAGAGAGVGTAAPSAAGGGGKAAGGDAARAQSPHVSSPSTSSGGADSNPRQSATDGWDLDDDWAARAPSPKPAVMSMGDAGVSAAVGNSGWGDDDGWGDADLPTPKPVAAKPAARASAEERRLARAAKLEARKAEMAARRAARAAASAAATPAPAVAVAPVARSPSPTAAGGGGGGGGGVAATSPAGSTGSRPPSRGMSLKGKGPKANQPKPVATKTAVADGWDDFDEF